MTNLSNFISKHSEQLPVTTRVCLCTETAKVAENRSTMMFMEEMFRTEKSDDLEVGAYLQSKVSLLGRLSRELCLH